MTHPIRLRRALPYLGLIVGLPALGQTLVKNPSFENNVNTNTPPLAAGAPQGWPYYGPIDDWQGGSGVNDLVYDRGGPFHNAGTPVPDGQRVGFKQGGGAVSQEIDGLVSGKRYWIQFRYDARSGSDLDLAVRFSTVGRGGALDEPLDVIIKPKPAITSRLPYYSRTVPFVADADGGTLSFVVTSRGDSTALLDAVTIVQRDEGNFPVQNPSFEASGLVFDGESIAGTDRPAISGWEKVGVAGVDDGTGGVADNGNTPEQALVAFITDEGSLTQTLEPLVKGDTYQVQFAYNAKSGTTPHLQLLVDGAVVWEEDVTAVGAGKDYRTKTASFKAASDVGTITFKNTTAGATVLLDQVKVIGKVGTRLPPLTVSPVGALLRVGEEGVGTITIPKERLDAGPASIKLRSPDRTVFELPEADDSGVLTLDFIGNTTSKTFRFRGTGVGSRTLDFADSAGLLLPAEVTTVFVAGSTHVLNPSFELDKDSSVGTAPITGWTTGGGNIGIGEVGNPFLSADDFGIPDRQKVLRMQGGGTVSQLISGLDPSQTYGLQFFYNGRSAGYPYNLSLQVSFGGEVVTSIPEVIPAGQNGLLEFYFVEARFKPKASSGVLEFKATVTSGDATLFLDAVSIVPRVDGEIAVMNSSFEGTAMGASWPGYLQPGRVAGWSASGGGYGVNAYSPTTFFIEPFFDNGINSDQDNVFFGQGSVSIRQNVAGLTAGKAYTLVVDYNNRDGRGRGSSLDPNPGQIDISIGGSSVFTSPEYPPVDSSSPWPGYAHTRPFYQAFVPFTAPDATTEILLAHVGVAGDETVLFDNVRIVPGTAKPPVITGELADQSVPAGGVTSFKVTATGASLRYRWFRDGIPLVDGARISGATTANLSITGTLDADAGTYSVLVSDGVGVVGSLALLTVEASEGLPDLRTAVEAGTGARLILWDAASAAGAQLESSDKVTGPWGPDAAAVQTKGADNYIVVTPAGLARFYRLSR